MAAYQDVSKPITPAVRGSVDAVRLDQNKQNIPMSYSTVVQGNQFDDTAALSNQMDVREY